MFTDGSSVATEFTIIPPADVKPGDLPQTGDDALHPAVYGLMALISLAGIGILLKKRR
jgi:LPXTG-motif cell wall-anchored protein